MRCDGLSALRQAAALLAWVLLGWLGQRLGWSFASGVLPVVVWWALRCSGTAFFAHRAAPNVWPLAGAAGLLAVLPLLPAGTAALAVLLLAAALWGGWSASLARSGGDASPTLPGLAMGLMMGSLWLASQWCLGPGWTPAQAVALHGGLMLGVPLLAAALRRTGRWPASAPAWTPVALLAAGALLMAWPDATAWRLAGMVLLVLAWAPGAHGTHPAGPTGAQVPTGLGPALLLAVGWLAPTQGPAAMQAGWAIVAVLALAALLRWRPHRPAVPLNAPQHWSDAP
jgi:hypothetical protein